MYCNFQGKGCNFFLPNLSFLSELQPEIILFIGIPNSNNIPGGTLKIIHQIRSKGFLVIITMDPPLFIKHQIIVQLFVVHSIPQFTISLLQKGGYALLIRV
jgi:hypothetical protein